MCSMLVAVLSYYASVCHFVFFFKQKTAYEMRISDWSSDVCSSDLLHGDLIVARAIGAADLAGVDLLAVEPYADGVVAAAAEDRSERASCRERVCQYV